MSDSTPTGIGLSGQIVDGKVVIDPFGVEETSTTNDINPGDSFVAVNAPFDPESVDLESAELQEAVEA